MRVCVDVDFALRAVLNAPVVAVNHFIMDYDWRADSLCRRELDRASVEVTLLRLEFASKRETLAGEEFPAVQSASLGLVTTAFLQKDWLMLARVVVPLLRYVDGRLVVRTLARRLIARV